MPPDKRRSISYRSFVTCDDPKGGVDCGAIRKTKISSQKREQQCNKVVEGDKKQDNLIKDTSLAVNKEDKKEMGIRGITGELETPASFQLQEVSKGADKLNHVINSYYKGKGGKQKDIACSLLRGALDLQESLVMLGKLQEEASSLMSRSRRKQKQKLEEGTFDGMLSGVNVMSSDQFGYLQDEKLHRGFEKPRKSSDGLKKAVRESLLRQTVITNPIFEEHYDQRKLRSPDVPSTSSSQSSSMVRSSNFAPSDSSTSSTTSQRRRRRDLNLIVKLMGLESSPSSPLKHMEGGKILNLLKPIYDIDSPRARNSHYGVQEFSEKQRTVDEILQTLKFKGILRSNAVNGRTPNSPESGVFPLKDRRIDERPPIVVMKPWRFSCQEEEGPITPRFLGETVSKQTYSRGLIEKIVSNEASNSNEKYKAAGDDCIQGGNFVRKNASPRAKASVNLDVKPQKKQADSRKVSEVEKFTAIRRKGEEKKDAKSSDELRSRDQEKLTLSKIIKQKDGSFISKHESSRQQNITSASILDRRKQETCHIPLVENHRCKGKVKERVAIHREVIASASDNDSALPTVNSMITDNFYEKSWPEAYKIQIRDSDVDNQSSISEIQEEIEYHENKMSLCDIALSGRHENCHRHDDNHSSYSEVTSVSTSEHSNFGHLDENPNPISEVTLATTHENGVAVHLSDTAPLIPYDTGMESSGETNFSLSIQDSTPRKKLKALLLNNPLFVSHLEELFDIQVHPELVPCMTDNSDQNVGSTRVYTDYANELLQLQKNQFSQAYLPQTWMYTTKPRNSVSLDQLLEEVCNAIEDLRCYHRPASDDNFSSDNLYVILDQDLSLKSGIWDIGWRRMFSEKDIEQVISEVDQLMLGKVIEEILSEIMS